ncbi:unnamed protein product [Scytosiphon promiscuus]
MPASTSTHRSRLDGFEVEIFKLIQQEATLEQWTQWLRAPLEHAAAKGNVDLFTRLIAAGADSSAGWRGCHGRTLVGAAAHGENERIVAYLLRKGREDVNTTFGNSRRSPLHAAAARGAQKVSKLLLHAGANPNQADNQRRTPLHLAAEAGHSGIVSDLLLKGAGPNWTDDTNLRQAAVHLAASWGHAECVSELLLGAAAPDQLNANGMTPVHLATLGSHRGAVQELCAAGCDPQIRARNGRSALDSAIKTGDVHVVRLLLTRHCNVNAADHMGRTPLHWATAQDAHRRDNGPIVRLLVEAGAKTEATSTALELTPLHRASFRHAPGGTVRALLEAGANVNAIARDNSTPLQYACEQSNAACVELLLRWGADETLGAARSKVGAWDQGLPGSDSDAARDDAERRADDECIRRMLERALADRSWRRRGWLVLCRSRPGKFQLVVHNATTTSTAGGSAKKKLATAGQGAQGGDSDIADNQALDLGLFVRDVVGVKGDDVFRLIVGFL